MIDVVTPAMRSRMMAGIWSAPIGVVRPEVWL